MFQFGFGDVKRLAVNIAASATDGSVLIPAVSGKKIVVLSYFLIAGGAVDVTFVSDGDSNTALTGVLPLTADGSGIADRDAVHGLFETAVGEGLGLSLSGSVEVDGYLSYVVV